MEHGKEYIVRTENDGIYWAKFDKFDGHNAVFRDTIQKKSNGTINKYEAWCVRRWIITRIVKPEMSRSDFLQKSKDKIIEEIGGGS